MYVENKGILTPFQLGFRSGVSSQEAILYFVETPLQWIEKGNLVHAVFWFYLKLLTHCYMKSFRKIEIAEIISFGC